MAPVRDTEFLCGILKVLVPNFCFERTQLVWVKISERCERIATIVDVSQAVL